MSDENMYDIEGDIHGEEIQQEVRGKVNCSWLFEDTSKS